MKTLLKNGPRDGEVIDVHRDVFASGQITEIWDSKEEKLLSRTEHRYGISRTEPSRIKHPAKKKGLIRVFYYEGEIDRMSNDNLK